MAGQDDRPLGLGDQLGRPLQVLFRRSGGRLISRQGDLSRRDIFRFLKLSVLAKIDHILYKARAYNSILTGKKLLASVPPTDCRLGKWYSGEGKERFGQTGAYVKMNAPHTVVHENANSNLAFLDSSDPLNETLEHEKEILEKFEKMEEASEILFGLLDQMLFESQQLIDNKFKEEN